eukprot:CAMPEP_0183309288 /NCGR_PEP_ID=MMETSP0160_2-20130417/24840_1 /TAXON_ID=2839 ORGANISM="Odontella Sinensis, Strain Grunow 1884" /NCGR_SAMPLE_ID=MMETSP0160_2 /ASSEMBLY_ACC=CAM_ASM_000250 /LENGTH=501 /DNA_ID=CAMNT_0025473291 /DNA_START=93 /DNA_END=1598 /DNA_ORIENTATION=+
MAETRSSLTDATSWHEVVVILHSDGENVSTIPVRSLLQATETKRASYSALCRFAILSVKLRNKTGSLRARKSSSRSIAPDVQHDVRLCYKDEEGDEILFNSDVELMEALEWAASTCGNNRPHLHVFATVKPRVSAGRIIIESRVIDCKDPMYNEIEEKVKQEKKGPFSFLRRGCKRDIGKKGQNGHPFESVINNMLLFVGNAVSSLQEHHGRPRGIHKQDKRNTVLAPDLKEIIGRKRMVLLDSPQGVCLDADFVHKRHYCNGCNHYPIVGYRYHAINAYSIDLCQVCFTEALNFQQRSIGQPREENNVLKEKKETIKFQMSQHRTDQSFPFKTMPILLRLLGVQKCAGDVQLFLSKAMPVHQSRIEGMGIAGPDLANKMGGILGGKKVSDFDLAMAIQQSLRDLRRSKDSLDLRKQIGEGEESVAREESSNLRVVNLASSGIATCMTQSTHDNAGAEDIWGGAKSATGYRNDSFSGHGPKSVEEPDIPSATGENDDWCVL